MVEGGFYTTSKVQEYRILSRSVVKVQKYKGFLKVLKFEIRNVVENWF